MPSSVTLNWMVILKPVASSSQVEDTDVVFLQLILEHNLRTISSKHHLAAMRAHMYPLVAKLAG